MNRTTKQQASIEVYCREVADNLNKAGVTRQGVIELITLDLPWSQESVKELIWRTMQEAKGYGRKTSGLEAGQVAEVYEWCNLFTSTKLGINQEFPSNEEQLLNKND